MSEEYVKIRRKDLDFILDQLEAIKKSLKGETV
jgi:hypothetical protein